MTIQVFGTQFTTVSQIGEGSHLHDVCTVSASHNTSVIIARHRANRISAGRLHSKSDGCSFQLRDWSDMHKLQ
jgi:hypothetical protein